MKFKVSQDKNGNKILQVKPGNGRGFSIQTNGNLPDTHRNGVNEHTSEEVKQWVEAYGTKSQKALVANENESQ